MQVIGHRLQVAYCGVKVVKGYISSYRLHITEYSLDAAVYRLKVTGHMLGVTGHMLGVKGAMCSVNVAIPGPICRTGAGLFNPTPLSVAPLYCNGSYCKAYSVGCKAYNVGCRAYTIHHLV